MTDDRDITPDTQDDQNDNVENKIESLLPAPEARENEHGEHEQIDGPIDELLPVPGERHEPDDDTSTREELGVDTTADGVDDMIPLHDGEERNSKLSDTSPDVAQCLVCGSEIGRSRYCPECGTEQVSASKIVTRMAPLFMWSRPLAIRVTLTIGALLALLALLGDSGTNALIISAATFPVVILIRLADQLGGQNRSSWIQIALMALVGTAVGMPIAFLATRVVRRAWFDGGVFNFGATNFGGIAVETVGNPPFLVWLTSGLLLPLVMILAIGAGPSALRMVLAIPPREGTGMILSAAVATGYMAGSAIVFYWPFFNELIPIMSTSEWTLTILGVAVLRPLVWVYSGAIIGAVMWRYLRNASLPGITIPAAIGIGLPLGYSLLSLAMAPAGLWGSFIIGIAFAAAAVFLHTRFLATALSNDLNIAI